MPIKLSMTGDALQRLCAPLGFGDDKDHSKRRPLTAARVCEQ